MTIIPAFLKRCDAFCDRRGMSRARLSTLLFDDGKRIDAIDGGSNVGVLTLQRAAEALEGLEAAEAADSAPGRQTGAAA